MNHRPFSRWLLITLLLFTFALSGCAHGGDDDDDEAEGRSSEMIELGEEAETDDENEDEGEDED